MTAILPVEWGDESYMRVYAAFVVLGVLVTGQAHASSFVALEPMTEKIGPSMVLLGAPAPAKPTAAATVAAPKTALAAPKAVLPSGTMISPSIVAFGEPLPEIEYTKVAAIPEPKKQSRRPAPMPMVMRGGIIGEGFTVAAPAQPQAEAKPQDVASARNKDGPSPEAPGAPEAPPPPLAIVPQSKVE
jgi:hypothetical protein